RIHVAANRDDREVGPHGLELHAAAERRGSNAGARRELREARAGARNERVARVLPLGKAAEPQARHELARNVLGGVHREIGLTVEQALLDLFDEETLAADLRERTILNPIARRRDGELFDREQRLEPSDG